MAPISNCSTCLQVFKPSNACPYPPSRDRPLAFTERSSNIAGSPLWVSTTILPPALSLDQKEVSLVSGNTLQPCPPYLLFLPTNSGNFPFIYLLSFLYLLLTWESAQISLSFFFTKRIKSLPHMFPPKRERHPFRASSFKRWSSLSPLPHLISPFTCSLPIPASQNSSLQGVQCLPGCYSDGHISVLAFLVLSAALDTFLSPLLGTLSF